MTNYTIYFEIFGKKMKTTVMAENEEKAREIVKNKLIFLNIENHDEYVKRTIDAMEECRTMFNEAYKKMK
jgi:hypothetical protein